MGTPEIVVLFGGASGERRVSVASAQHIVEVLGERAAAWFVAPDGRVYDCPREALARHTRVFETDLAPDERALAFPTLAAALDAPAARDAVFVLGFHGGAGEDGTVQRELEARGLAFTGSGAAASARAFDKAAAKAVARARGVLTADAVMLPRDARGARDALEALLAAHGRAVAKPVADGSSVGLFHVKSSEDVPAVVAAVTAPDAVSYLAEAFVAGRELTVGVVEGPEPGQLRALPLSEVRIAPGRAFDFEGKYLGKGTEEITPAEVSPEVAAAASRVGLTLHAALGCEGYSRTDVIVRERDGAAVFLETNTLPGLTRASFLPQQLAAEHTSVRAFLDGQIALARARQQRARRSA